MNPMRSKDKKTEHIFISYARTDRDFAFRLAQDLERFYTVWIDTEELSGGEEWEKMIEQAINNCGVFAVIVSNASNDSKWVKRETMYADQLNKFSIPLLLNGTLPLRLLNVQYVDFQGEYEGGLRDLLEVVKKQLKPEDRNQNEANCLIGEGLRSYFAGNYPTANSLIGQALILDSSITDSVDTFWARLREKRDSSWANELMPQIQIRETGEWPDPPIYEMREGTRYEYYAWAIELAASDAILDKIDYVSYKLHETYREPVQIVRARDQKFGLRALAWGTFGIEITINFKDGSVGTGSYELAFMNRQMPLSPQ